MMRARMVEAMKNHAKAAGVTPANVCLKIRFQLPSSGQRDFITRTTGSLLPKGQSPTPRLQSSGSIVSNPK